MSSPSPQPEQHGAFLSEHAPQVVVRAGKTFVCSSCGVLIEIPEDVVGQLVVAVGPSSQEPPVAEEPVDAAPSQDEAALAASSPTQPVLANGAARVATAPKHRPPRPKRPQAPKPNGFAGETIDGLRVPSSHELDRALAWVSFHLKVLDRQGSEIKRLQKLLKKQATGPVPKPSPLGRVAEVSREAPIDHGSSVSPSHAHADLVAAPAMDHQSERGPPKRRGPP
ncbi:hypothetical protein [Bremerella sp. P1]|uniref:hypothetical protein n=1 Tax=Bremerella sp. P1 TaxID=3026424 RepID=UPI002368EA28|nr:hypothetical protein [Bremerella sp. P1]WDI42592.1 hypothetical protein PSR63_01360 [Bremerella sp. P1]